MTQLSLFGPQDRADQLAAAALQLAWACQQARGKLTDHSFALVLGELALAHQRLDSVTLTRLALPAIAEIRERQRSRGRAARPSPEPAQRSVSNHPESRTFPPVHFRDDRPAWAARTPEGEP